MAKSAGEIYYEIEADASGLIDAQRQASKSLDSLGTSADKSSQKLSGLTTTINKIAGAIAASIITDWAKAFLVAADNMSQLNARVERLTGSAANASQTMQTLMSISSTTGGSLQDTEKLWETLSTALRDTGATNGQLLQLTETLQKIGRIGGSSSEEMANALRQFGQSISSGVVRAEEFNSILEQMPELARQISAGMGISIGELRQLMLDGKLSAQDALNAIQKQTSAVNDEFEKLPRTLSQANTSFTNSFLSMVDSINKATGASSGFVAVIDSITAALDQLMGKSASAAAQIADLTSTAEMFERRARAWSWVGMDGWEAQNKALAGLSNRAALLVRDMDEVGKSTQQAANMKPIEIKSTSGNNGIDKLEKTTKRRLELSKLEGEARARLQAQYDAEDAGITDSRRIKSLQDEYAATERNTSARKASNAEGKKSASQAESISQKIENLRQKSELAATSTTELSRSQAILTAQQSLGKGATQQQIQLAGQYAAKAWDAAAAAKGVTEALKAIPEKAEDKSYTDSMDNLRAALKAGQIEQQEYNVASEQLEQQHQANLAKIRAQQVVSPAQEAVAQIDPVQQLANQHAQELALIQQFEQQGLLAHENALALKNAADTQYEQQRTAAQWQLLSQQSLGYEMLTSAVDSFSGNASNALTGLLTGTMSAQEAMRSLGNTILNSVINSIVQVGVEALKNYILGQTLGAASVASTVGMAATTASAWAPAAAMASLATFGANAAPAAAGITSTVGLASGLAVAGARYNGGPVSAGGMYQVGEKGKPEIYKASNGSQYMIPGDNGRVISNKDLQGSGGRMNVTHNVYNYASGVQVDTQSRQQDGQLLMETFITDMQNGGPMSSQMQQTFGLNRKATGDY